MDTSRLAIISGAPIRAIFLAMLLMLAGSAVPPESRGAGLGGDAGVRADACAKALLKAGAARAGQQTKVLGGCVDRLFACLQTKADGTKRDGCVAKAVAKCRDARAALTGLDAKLAAAAGKKCAGLGLADLTSTDGLGYSLLAGECAAILGTPLASLDDVVTCVARRTACHAEAALAAAAPRAKSILRATGVVGPGDDPLVCLPDDGGDASAVADRVGAGKALDKCVRGARKAGATFAAKKLKILGGCVAALFACEQRADDPAACRAKATGTCAKAFGAIAAAEAKIAPAVAKACGAVPFATLAAPAGGGVAGLAATCALHGVAPVDSLDAYADCLFRQHECRVEAMVQVAAPRAGALLAGASLQLNSAFCPDAPAFPTPTPAATPSRTATPKPTATPGPGACGNGLVDGAAEVCDGAALGGATCATLGFAGGTLACAPSCAGFDSTACALPATLPPEPAAVAPDLDGSAGTDIGDAVAFLFAGANRVQYGLTAATLDPAIVAVVRGKVVDTENGPLPGVEVRVHGRPELGATQTRADGAYDLVVNGGALLTLDFEKAGLLPAQRQVHVPWRDYVTVPDLALAALDTAMTEITVGAGAPAQMHRGSTGSDSEGTRTPLLLVPAGTSATVVMPDGSTTPMASLGVRATEYTLGAMGPATMPGALPPTSGYTYAVEFSADEAIAMGAARVEFDQPIIHYVENFLGFPVGGIVPVGFYDREKAAWVPSDNGLVVKIVSETGGLADLDLDGSGNPATPEALAALGVTDAERQQLASEYVPGQTLWRVPIPHFTPWDCNWPMGPPDGATPPNQPPVESDEPIDGQCEAPGSIIGCENQTLGEAVSVAGTPFQLHYRSDRTPTRRALRIPLSGSSVPGVLKRIDVHVDVAGQSHDLTFAAAPNQTALFNWDGNDGYGRPVRGGQVVSGTVSYVYDAVFRTPADFAQSFAATGATSFIGVPGRGEILLPQAFQATVGSLDARAQALGGWTISPHHAYDVAARVLHTGDGRRRTVDTVERVIDTIVPQQAQALALGPDGHLYFSVFVSQGTVVRRLDLSTGAITTIAGGGSNAQPPDFGDGGPALQAALFGADGLAFGPDGALYMMDLLGVRKVQNGIITRVAGFRDPGGNNGCSLSPDGPALDVKLCPSSNAKLAVGPDGSIYFPDGLNNRVMKVGPDGFMRTIAGTGAPCDEFFGAPCGDGGPATEARLRLPMAVQLDKAGNLYISDFFTRRIRKVGVDGIITTVIGQIDAFAPNFSGDGGPAVDASLNGPFAIQFGPDGSLYFPESCSQRIRRIDGEGIVNTIAGSAIIGQSCSDGTFKGDGGSALQADFRTPIDIAVAPDETVFVADLVSQRIRRIGKPFPGFVVTDIAVPSDDGSEIYRFDNHGRHLDTRHGLAGAVIREFVYDDDRLVQIVDKTGGTDNVTTIERSPGGSPTAIVAPFGQRTELGLDGNGFLATITDPAGKTVALVNDSDGLLGDLADKRDQTTAFDYGAGGLLTHEDDPANGEQTLVRTDVGEGFAVERTTALGLTTRFAVEPTATDGTARTVTAPDGTETTSLIPGDGTITVTGAEGSVFRATDGPDPRFGMSAPIPARVAFKAPSGLELVTTFARTAQLTSDRLGLVSQTDTIDHEGRQWTVAYTNADRTLAVTSPEGRVRTLGLDALGRPSAATVPGAAAASATLDARGRLATLQAGTGQDARVTTFGYDGASNVASVTDALDRTTLLEHDGVGRVTKKTTPDGREVLYGYDARGNLTSLTTPGGDVYTLAYTPRNELAAVTPPAVGGTGPVGYTWDADGRLTTVTRPGAETITIGYDVKGRPSTRTLATGGVPTAVNTTTYEPTLGTAASVVAASGVTVAFARDGHLITGQTYTGPIAGTVTRTYTTSLLTATETVGGTTAIAFDYDDDDLLVAAGDLAVTRAAASGLPTATALGVVADATTYDAFGAPATHTVTASGTQRYAVAYTRDALGRITEKAETVEGVAKTFTYAYDLAGRLIEVHTGGVLTEEYDWDDDGNRTFVGPGGTTASFDAQDRLTQQGTTTFTYDGSGRLATRTAGAAVTTYDYDAVGNLLGVELPDGTDVEYLVDGFDRRVGKRVDGALVQGFLYANGLTPAAELDGTGAVVSRFVYAGDTTPAYVVRGGAAHRIVTDQVGSVRLVIDATTGAVVQRLDYDSFGKVTLDTNPGFQPFGYAGGLYDPDTKLVRFGARDYDASTGRWTAKDPIWFAGLDHNLYRYALGDPINRADPTGLFEWVDFAVGAGDQIWESIKQPSPFTFGLHVIPQLIDQVVNLFGYETAVDALASLYEEDRAQVRDDTLEYYLGRACGFVGQLLVARGVAGGAGAGNGANALGKAANGIARAPRPPALQLISAAERDANIARIIDQEAAALERAAAQQVEKQAVDKAKLELVKPEHGNGSVSRPRGSMGDLDY